MAVVLEDPPVLVFVQHVCPGGATDCDLLPDMTSSYKEINLNHSETPGFLDISNATPNIGYGRLKFMEWTPVFVYHSCSVRYSMSEW
ncbi:MAG: hypothetical protein IPG90_16440 [Bacteroidetes bacterium]|nr:hypothetical protein [Bacteroidota bacterium]